MELSTCTIVTSDTANNYTQNGRLQSTVGCNPRRYPDSYPVAIFVFWGERRLGVRLRRARGLMGRDEGKEVIIKMYVNRLNFISSVHPTGFKCFAFRN